MTATIALRPRMDWLSRLRTINLGLGGRGVMGLGLGRSAVSAATGPWWTTSTLAASDAVVIYQPARAASYAASLLDLSGNGHDVSFTFNGFTLPEQRRPAWAEDTGWQHLTDPVNTTYGRIQFVAAGVYPASTWTMFVVYDNVEPVSNQVHACGCRLNGSTRYFIWPYYFGTYYFGHNAAYTAGSSVLTGDAILSGASFSAISGVQKNTNMATFTGTINVQMGIGGMPTEVSSYVSFGGVFKNGRTKAFALWNRTLTWQEYLDVRGQCLAAIA